MELKRVYVDCWQPDRWLLIRPEWNWNSYPHLKLAMDSAAFNQTRMELKRWPEKRKISKKPSFNQTRMELKRASWLPASRPLILLIRPEWNWNNRPAATTFDHKNLLIRPEWNWNGGHGLCWFNSPRLLIRPEWNWNRYDFKGVENLKGLLIRPEWNWNPERDQRIIHLCNF